MSAPATLPRVPGFDGAVVVPGDPGYELLASTYVAVGRPAIVARATSTTDVAAALRQAHEQRLPLAVRSGGHGLSGRSTNVGGLVLDLATLDAVEILDRGARRVRLGTGATWSRVARELTPLGWAVSSGNNGDVGVGGIATQGGIGFLVRAHGLTIDHVRRAELVLPDGRVLSVDDEHEPDLFWAVRGGGATVGVVTAVEVEADPVGDVVYTEAVHDADDPAALSRSWARSMSAAPRRLTSFLHLRPARHGRGPIALAQHVWAGRDLEAATHATAPLLDAGPVRRHDSATVPYPELLHVSGAPHVGQQRLVIHNVLLRRWDADRAEALAELMAAPGVVNVELRSIEGAANDVPVAATAWAHRHARIFAAVWIEPGRRKAAEVAWQAFTAEGDEVYGAYSSRLDPDIRRRAFPSETGARLTALARSYDPDGVLVPSSPVAINTCPSRAAPHRGTDSK